MDKNYSMELWEYVNIIKIFVKSIHEKIHQYLEDTHENLSVSNI